MRVQLSTGEAKVRVIFGPQTDHYRQTVVQVDNAAGGHFSGMALCSPADQFCPRTGRKVALDRLLAIPVFKLVAGRRIYARSGAFTREDRRALWQAICPDFVRGGLND